MNEMFKLSPGTRERLSNKTIDEIFEATALFANCSVRESVFNFNAALEWFHAHAIDDFEQIQTMMADVIERSGT